jgi:hypothetical protein
VPPEVVGLAGLGHATSLTLAAYRAPVMFSVTRHSDQDFSFPPELRAQRP